VSWLSAVIAAPFVIWGLRSLERIVLSGAISFAPGRLLRRQDHPFWFWSFCALVALSYGMLGLGIVAVIWRSVSG
jgi:hypothetical protein